MVVFNRCVNIAMIGIQTRACSEVPQGTLKGNGQTVKHTHKHAYKEKWWRRREYVCIRVRVCVSSDDSTNYYTSQHENNKSNVDPLCILCEYPEAETGGCKS